MFFFHFFLFFFSSRKKGHFVHSFTRKVRVRKSGRESEQKKEDRNRKNERQKEEKQKPKHVSLCGSVSATVKTIRLTLRDSQECTFRYDISLCLWHWLSAAFTVVVFLSSAHFSSHRRQKNERKTPIFICTSVSAALSTANKTMSSSLPTTDSFVFFVVSTTLCVCVSVSVPKTSRSIKHMALNKSLW